MKITSIVKPHGRRSVPAAHHVGMARPTVVYPPSVAIRAAESGTACIVYRRDSHNRVSVSHIERLPSGLDPLVAWVDQHVTPRTPVVLDGDGMGMAVADRLQVRRRRQWTLYAKRGRERQALVDGLLVALSEGRVYVAPSRHDDAMRRAMAAFRRQVLDDGEIGSELVVALALTLVGPRPGRRLVVY